MRLFEIELLFIWGEPLSTNGILMGILGLYMSLLPGVQMGG